MMIGIQSTMEDFFCGIFVQGYYAVFKSNQKTEFAIPHGMFFQNWTIDRELDWDWNISDMKKTRNKIFENRRQNQSQGP